MAAVKKRDYVRFSVSVPEELNAQFEEVRTRLEMSRSDAIRKGMRLFLNHYANSSGLSTLKMVLGTISYLECAHSHGESHVYAETKPPLLPHVHHDHRSLDPSKGALEGAIPKVLPHTHELDADSYYFPVDQLEFIKVNNLQHQFLDVIISTTHIHAGPSKCMIVIHVQGMYSRVIELVNSLSSFKTIENIEFTPLETFSAQ